MTEAIEKNETIIIKRCGACVFWERNKPEEPNCAIGACHRYAPKPELCLIERGVTAYWPTTSAQGWCGEAREITCQN